MPGGVALLGFKLEISRNFLLARPIIPRADRPARSRMAQVSVNNRSEKGPNASISPTLAALYRDRLFRRRRQHDPLARLAGLSGDPRG